MKKTNKNNGTGKKNYKKLVKVYLKNKKDIVCSHELAEEIGCCTKTVRDSIRELIMDGEPIATFWGKGGGHKYTTSVMEHQHCLNISNRVIDRMNVRSSILQSNTNTLKRKSNNKLNGMQS